MSEMQTHPSIFLHLGDLRVQAASFKSKDVMNNSTDTCVHFHAFTCPLACAFEENGLKCVA